MGTFSVVPDVVESGIVASLGASPQIRFYSGTPPANAAAALSGNTLLATLTCSATPITGWTDTGTAARATFDAITSAAAGASATATFWRLLKSDGTTVRCQGSVGVLTGDILLSAVAMVAGVTVTLTALTIDFPYGP